MTKKHEIVAQARSVHLQRDVTPKIRMTLTKFFKRACIGAASLAALSAASAVGLYDEAPNVWKAAAARLKSMQWDMDSMLVAANGGTDSVWLALLGLGFMGVLVKRNSGR